VWISLLCFSFGSCSLSSYGSLPWWLFEWKYLFKLQRTVMNHKEEILLLKNKLRAVQTPPGYFRWWLLLYVAVSVHPAAAFSSPFYGIVKKWGSLHSHKLLWVCRLPWFHPSCPLPPLPQPVCSLPVLCLIPEKVFWVLAQWRKRQIDLHFLSGRFTCKI